MATNNPPPINTVTVGYPTFVTDIPRGEPVSGSQSNMPGMVQQGVPVNINTNYNPYDPARQPRTSANYPTLQSDQMVQPNMARPNPMNQPNMAQQNMPQQNIAQPQAGGRQVEVIIVNDPLLNPLSAPVLPILGDFPAKFHCPRCNTDQISIVSHTMGAGGWFWFCLWCFIFPPVSLCACCCPPLMDSIHSCPNCGHVVGINPALC